MVLGYFRHVPEFKGLRWINSEPLAIKELKRKPVLIDFWNYSCLSCITALKETKRLYRSYHPKGLQVIGIHVPEFQFEKEKENVKRAVEKYGIQYPVAMDNRHTTCRRYGNLFWPHQILIDPEGRMVYETTGEKGIRQMKAEIRHLLGMHEKTKQFVYFGKGKAQPKGFRWDGRWAQTKEGISTEDKNARLRSEATAKRIHAVIETLKKGSRVRIKTPEKVRRINIEHSDRYQLFQSDTTKKIRMELAVIKGKVRICSFSLE